MARDRVALSVTTTTTTTEDILRFPALQKQSSAKNEGDHHTTDWGSIGWGSGSTKLDLGAIETTEGTASMDIRTAMSGSDHAPDGSGGGLGMMDFGSHGLNFDGDGLLDGMAAIPFTPAYDLDTFSSTFEDPFSYQTDSYTGLNHNISDPYPSTADPSANNEPASENPDNKLLSFGPPISKCTLLSNAGAQTWPSMTAELYGMFFVAEDVFGDAVPPATRPMELTCYRRNLFQISGSITIDRGIKSVIDEQGQHSPICELSATLSAIESIEGKQTEIISVPWKTASQGVPGSEDKSGNLPPKWPLDLSLNPELDPELVSIPVAWKRLQFKHATANNGRRKGLQQHYIIQINLVGLLGNGETIKLAEIQSGPIIVRGRSPRNFDSRKDINLSAGASSNTIGTPMGTEHKPRTSSDSEGNKSARMDSGVSNGNFKFYTVNTVQQPLDLPDWNTPSSIPPLTSPVVPVSFASNDVHLSKRPSIPQTSSSFSASTPLQNPRPPVPKANWGGESTSSHDRSNQAASYTAPIDLSIAEEEQYGAVPRSGGRGSMSRALSFGDRSPVLDRTTSGDSASGGVGSSRRAVGMGSPIENADLLYEYFPLSLDDWMPPVDAIYRPHVVHHTIVPPDLKAEQVKNKTKRYFSADD